MPLAARSIFFNLAICILLLSCTREGGAPSIDHHLRYDSLYSEYGLQGCFVLLYEGDTVPYVYQPELASTPRSPASTFKIPNALIALETGVLTDTAHRLPWDGQHQSVTAWNLDHSLNTAFRNSVVWYFQEVARSIGAASMQQWLDTLGYGNRNISGGIDQFWLDGSLKITPVEQVAFIQRLARRELPFSVLSQDRVMGLLEQERTPEYVLGGKTGWSKGDSLMTGWFVGYLMNSYDTVYFANCIQTADTAHPFFGSARRMITIRILQDRALLPSE